MEIEEPSGLPCVLVVDDEPSVTYLIARRLEEDGLECERAESAKDALEQLKRRRFDVVVTDIRMPGMSGIKLLKRIKDMDSETQVIVMTGHAEVQFAVEAIRSDVDDYLLKPFELEQLSHAVGRAMEHRALQQENRAYRRQLEERVHEQAAQIERLFLDGLAALAAAIEARDNYTGGHLDRVSRYALATGSELGLEEERMWSLWLGSLFHDVGKLAIPDAILNKPGPLTGDEFEEIKRHPELGVRIMERASFLLPAARAVMHHQERWDGDGYPRGLSGEQISIEGRVLAVADAFDAMLTNRPYREARSEDLAVEELRRCAGSQFDPGVVDAFLRAREKGFPWSPPESPYSATRTAVGEASGPPS